MITIQEFTYKNPISMMGMEAGVCYNSDTTNLEKNYKRGIENLESNHGRVWEFPDVYMIMDNYSAKVFREFYTHIGGSPTRLQGSTRYIDYAKNNFKYVTPHTIEKNKEALNLYDETMNIIRENTKKLEDMGIPKEDSSYLLPLGMESKVVVKINFRTLSDMSHQRLCTRALWEYRELFNDIKKALGEYSTEWKYLVDNYFMAKCEVYGYCPEKRGCGRKPKKENK